MRNTSLRKICRDEIDPNALYGLVLGETVDFLLIAREYDFFIDGFQVIRKADITSSTNSASSRYVFKILKSEGLLKSLLSPEIVLESWRSIFQSLGRKMFVQVQNEETGDFTIGPIVRINKQSVILRYFDPVGKWGDEESIKYTDITTLQFSTNYINFHAKYIQP